MFNLTYDDLTQHCDSVKGDARLNSAIGNITTDRYHSWKDQQILITLLTLTFFLALTFALALTLDFATTTLFL